VAVSTLLNGLVEAYQPVAEEKAQDLQADIRPGLCVDGDRELLTQLFANLIDNAIGHSPAGAQLSIKAAATLHGVQVCVSDTGPGIPAPYRQKVLQRFYRLETSRTTPGSGLGLSLVNAVAALHDATLDLRDNEPGLQCVLWFPKRNEGQDADGVGALGE
jgi:signal transduction histidine kinase